jgi:hypothetical protein
MPILMDRTLTEYADQALAAIRLRRNSVHTARALTSAELLFLLETAGDAMVRGHRWSNCLEGDTKPLSVREGP